MMGCPLLIMVGVGIIFSIFATMAASSGSISAIVTVSIVGSLAVLLGIGVMQGVFAAQWYGMLANNLQYGKLKFSGSFSMKKNASVLCCCRCCCLFRLSRW